MRTAPMDWVADPPPCTQEHPCRIRPDNRPLTLVQRAADGAVHPRQGPAYGHYMAHAIEAVAQEIEGGQPGFELLWQAASGAVAAYFMQQRDFSWDVQPSRAQRNLAAFARELVGYDPPGFATAHAEYECTRTDFIAHRIEPLAERIRTQGVFDAAREAWVLGDYLLVRVESPPLERFHAPESVSVELRIPSPPLQRGEPVTHAAWRLKSNTAHAPAQLRHRLFDNPEFEDTTYRYAVSVQVDALLKEVGRARRPYAARAAAFEAYWWMLRQTQIAVGDKAQFVLQAVLLAAGQDLPPAPCGVDPALEALSRTLPDWLDHAPWVWGTGVGPRAVLERQISGRRL